MCGDITTNNNINMKKNVVACFLTGLLIVSVFSCSKDMNVKTKSIDKKPEMHARIKGISKEIVELSESDAVMVADMFLASTNSTMTRSSDELKVKSVVPINGYDGKPAIYAVNYDDGFMWISATKKLYPVLAVADKGNFETDGDVGMGIDVLKEAILAESDSLTFNTVPQEVKKAWSLYEAKEQKSSDYPLTTKAYSQDYLNALDEVYSYAALNEYDVYKLDEMVGPEGVTSDIVPEDILQDFYMLVMDDYTFGTEVTYNTAYVLKKEYFEETTYGPYTTTKWNQDAPFNSAVFGGLDLGCVTVATAQLMRYYEKPSEYMVDGKSYKWKEMPNDTSSPELSVVLADLRKKLKIDNDGGGYINDAVALLNSYGYNVKSQDFSSSINPFIARGNISIMDGERNEGDKKVGHAWICDGLRECKYYTDYKLFALDNKAYPEYSYICIEYVCEQDYGHNWCSYHMNWGWGGSHDGWFYEARWKPTDNRNYKYNQGMVVVKIK